MEFREADQVNFSLFFLSHSSLIFSHSFFLRLKKHIKNKMLSLLVERELLERNQERFKRRTSRSLFSFLIILFSCFFLKGMRYYKSIGLGFKTPKTAIEGTYVDKKCPFTGNVSIRGRILTGIVVSTKMKRTVIIRRDYLQYIKKYRRYVSVYPVLTDINQSSFFISFNIIFILLISILRFEKRHSKLAVHCSPAFPNVSEGDVVTVGQCRPLAKTVKFNVLEHQPAVNKVSFSFHQSPSYFYFHNCLFIVRECQENF